MCTSVVCGVICVFVEACVCVCVMECTWRLAGDFLCWLSPSTLLAIGCLCCYLACKLLGIFHLISYLITGAGVSTVIDYRVWLPAGSGDLNLAPYACASNTLPTEAHSPSTKISNKLRSVLVIPHHFPKACGSHLPHILLCFHYSWIIFQMVVVEKYLLKWKVPLGGDDSG